MSNSSEESVLLGALLDRLGKAQAQVLLARLDQWMTRDRGNAPAFDQDQKQVTDSAYDRRKRDGNGIHNPDSNSASQAPKDRQA